MPACWRAAAVLVQPPQPGEEGGKAPCGHFREFRVGAGCRGVCGGTETGTVRYLYALPMSPPEHSAATELREELCTERNSVSCRRKEPFIVDVERTQVPESRNKTRISTPRQLPNSYPGPPLLQIRFVWSFGVSSPPRTKLAIPISSWLGGASPPESCNFYYSGICRTVKFHKGSPKT